MFYGNTVNYCKINIDIRRSVYYTCYCKGDKMVIEINTNMFAEIRATENRSPYDKSLTGKTVEVIQAWKKGAIGNAITIPLSQLSQHDIDRVITIYETKKQYL